MSDTPITPKALALELEVDPKALRGWLRRNFPRDAKDKGKTWNIPAEVADAARKARVEEPTA